MPLRKRHVRRFLALALMVCVLGTLGALAIYGFWFRGGGYDQALKAELETRLRCQATVAGVRPTGLGTAEASEVALTWEAAGGRLVLGLSRLAAKACETPGQWDVSADGGILRLEGPRPLETLSALNQRLVQADGPTPVRSLSVDTLRVVLETDRIAVTDIARAEADVNRKGFAAVRFMRLAGPNGQPNEAPDAVLNLRPASPEGVFNGFTADVGDFPARRIVSQRSRTKNAKGKIDVDVDWPATGRKPVFIEIGARELEMADWTGSVPGGPVAGTLEVTLVYRKAREKRAELDVRLTVRDGRMSAMRFAGWRDFQAGRTRGPVRARSPLTSTTCRSACTPSATRRVSPARSTPSAGYR